MSTEEWLRSATAKLAAAGIATGRLDALVLLEDTLRTDRALLLAHPDTPLDAMQTRQLTKLINRRATHEPLAYIRQKTEFYGREFYVDHHVLEPRPESETMIDLLKDLPGLEVQTIIDVGTGSGALAITAKLELPQARVVAIDIDTGCLRVAARNGASHQAHIRFATGDLLAPCSAQQLDGSILLCNLPYVPDTFQINPAAMQEPRRAIFGGTDGLDLYRQLFSQIRERRLAPAYVLAESMPPQHTALQSIANNASFVLTRTIDFVQVFKAAADSSAS